MMVLLASPLPAGFLGGWEFVVLAFLLMLVLARFGSMPARDHDPVTKAPPRVPLSRREEFILWLAQGLDVGRIPVAPGTFGSMVGLLWTAALLVPGSLTCYCAGTIVGLMFSVWCCGRAEKILGLCDPGSVVLDEITALPVCFLPWVIQVSHRAGGPNFDAFLLDGAWMKTAMLFALFRFFDVAKPWPVRQSQALPGGWGVTLDDLLAAAYVALLSMLWVR